MLLGPRAKWISQRLSNDTQCQAAQRLSSAAVSYMSVNLESLSPDHNHLLGLCPALSRSCGRREVAA
eukprot:766300-Hanusia_phi.AAC.3